jgi:hypothetical protein
MLTNRVATILVPLASRHFAAATTGRVHSNVPAGRAYSTCASGSVVNKDRTQGLAMVHSIPLLGLARTAHWRRQDTSVVGGAPAGSAEAPCAQPRRAQINGMSCMHGKRVFGHSPSRTLKRLIWRVGLEK